MQVITHGQNLVINDQLIEIHIECDLQTTNEDIDISAFLLAANNKVRNDDDFIFYNQPSTANQSIALTLSPVEKQSFKIDLSKIDSEIQKIAFVITNPNAFKLAKHLQFSALNIAQFTPNLDKMEETSLILAELYRHKGNWKMRAIGQGYAGGLAPVATNYGVVIDEEDEAADEAQADHTPAPAPAPAPAQVKPIAEAKTEIQAEIQAETQVETQAETQVETKAETQAETKPSETNHHSISTGKVDLSKSGEKATISLKKGQNLSAKLIWETKADLDLYCFYVDNSGKEDKVYYRQLGDLSNPPFIKLQGDSQVAGEETLLIAKPDNIKYALICAYSAVSNGTGSFHSYKAKVVVSDNDKQTVTSHLQHDDPKSYWVAFALIDFQDAGKVTIKNVESYANPKTFAEQFFQRTQEKPSTLFRKSKGSVNGVSKYHAERSPHLFKDGTFMMSAGVIEFK